MSSTTDRRCIQSDPADLLVQSALDQAHLDSQLRRHPRIYPIHIEAVEHLQLARNRLIATIEEALYHLHDADDRN